MDWDPGTAYMEMNQDGQVTLTSHRCWSLNRFKHARMEDAAQATVKGKVTTIRFLNESEYRKRGGK